MKIETFTNMGTTRYEVNEDFVFASETDGYIGVIDGASGLTGKSFTDCASDSAWFSSHLGANVQAELQTSDAGLIDALCKAGEATAAEYSKVTSGKPVAREDEPSATLAISRWDEEVLEAAVLGDCECVLHYRDGTSEVVKDNHLSGLSKEAIGRLAYLMQKEGMPFSQAREEINSHLIEIRLLRNKEGGYWVADISCLGYPHAVTKTVPVSELQGVFLCTDGFANALNMGVCSDLLELADAVRQGRGEEIFKELRARELADSDITSQPRFKISDDATYVYVWLNECLPPTGLVRSHALNKPQLAQLLEGAPHGPFAAA